MSAVYKYEIMDRTELRMPRGAKVLAVQVQNGAPRLWALVDPEQPEERRFFEVYGTGHPIPDIHSAVYVATFQVDDGAFVFHLFERISGCQGKSPYSF